MSTDQYETLQQELTIRAGKHGFEKHALKCTNSICRQVSGRIDQLRTFAAQYDVILFVSYQQSSNGRLLYSKCREVNQRTYFVTTVSDVNSEWFKNARSIGITGATSTPAWLLEEFRMNLLSIIT